MRLLLGWGYAVLEKTPLTHLSLSRTYYKGYGLGWELEELSSKGSVYRFCQTY